MKKSSGFGIFILVGLFLVVSPAAANKSAASIEGPESVAKGTEVTLRVTVTHNGNTPAHHTEWLVVKANNKEIARWDYAKENLPEAAEFTKEIKLIVTEDTEVTAEASCNRHGGKAPAILKINVE